MSKPKTLLSKGSLRFLRTAYGYYCDFAISLAAGCKGKEKPAITEASFGDSARISGFKAIDDEKASKLILRFNDGKDELGTKALKLIASAALDEHGDDGDDGFNAFIAEIENRITLALKS